MSAPSGCTRSSASAARAQTPMTVRISSAISPATSSSGRPHLVPIMLSTLNTLDSTCFEAQGVSGSKPSDLPGQGKALKAASGRWRRRRLCRRRGASRVPPRGGAAEVRHCPVPVRCSGWGSVPGSAAPGPCVTPWLHVRRDRGCTAAVTKVGRRSGRGLLLRMRPMPGHVFCGHGPPPAPEPLGSRAPAHSGARRGPEHPRPSRPNHCTDCHRACSCASDPASGM